MFTRRGFAATSMAALAAAAALPARAQDAVGFDDDSLAPEVDPLANNPWGLNPRFMPTRVPHRPGLTPGSLHVDPVARYLYHIGTDGTAMRYGVAVGRSGLQSPGTYTIGRKAEWPSWTPTAAMIAREPEVYGPYADGFPGGPDNPLGARALYLYDDTGRDTYLRIHGTPQPWTIGTAASSGCVRMINDHVIRLYDEVPIGTRATLYAPS
jgi:lipoprotein-anchoring transpeptidase ErfK/SrfK